MTIRRKPSVSLIRELVAVTIASRSSRSYVPDAIDKIMREYEAKAHMLKSDADLIDFLDNAIKSHEIRKVEW